jgi:hypothetical protein
VEDTEPTAIYFDFIFAQRLPEVSSLTALLTLAKTQKLLLHCFWHDKIYVDEEFFDDFFQY